MKKTIKFFRILFESLVFSLFVTLISVKADDLKSYTQPFQNNTTTLSGKSVAANMYFTKIDYWELKNATLNLNYKVSQLASNQSSDITISINGIKFYSFRPDIKSGMQTKQIKIPIKLINGSNNLKIYGQIINESKNNSTLASTPANWLTLYKGSNVNFQYTLKAPEFKINSFYNHFSGADTISWGQSVIGIPKDASNGELTAATYALNGQTRTLTTDTDQLPLTSFGSSNEKNANYEIVVALYKNLPKEYKKMITSEDVNNKGFLKLVYHNDKHVLIVTSQTTNLLQKAARFVANSELMEETQTSTEKISGSTRTYSSTLKYNGVINLTNKGQKLTGAGHQEAEFFVSLPTSRTNAAGSKIRLHLRYAKNLNFKNSLATVYINKNIIGSHRLSLSKADNDDFTVTVPSNLKLGNSLVVRVALDLMPRSTVNTDNSETPWAYIGSDSKAYINSQEKNDLLFSNYPSLFIRNRTYNQIAVVRPYKLSAYDLQTITNIFNLVGIYAESNTGYIRFYTKKPSNEVLKNKNLIVFGTPKNNSFIKELNKSVYFKFDDKFKGFVSNEKLSIEKNYGKSIGTDQLLRSPFNKERGLLVVTAAHDRDVYMATTQINFQKNITQHSGDAIVVDQNNNIYNYRFKKKAVINKKIGLKQNIQENSKLYVYLLVIIFVSIILITSIVLLLIKNKKSTYRKGQLKNEKQ
jgi:cellulose synthase (UDP-forming)